MRVAERLLSHDKSLRWSVHNHAGSRLYNHFKGTHQARQVYTVRITKEWRLVFAKEGEKITILTIAHRADNRFYRSEF